MWEPLPGDHGAHGRFDNQAQDYSAQLWATENQDWLVLALGAGVACVAMGAYLGYQAQPKHNSVRNNEDDKITESDIQAEIGRQLNQTTNRSSKTDNLNMLTSLARFAWNTLTAEPKK